MSLNTTPRTFVTAEIETAAIFNAELRDALTGIQAAEAAYTPALGGITIGNGVLDCAWTRVGKLVDGRFQLTLGTTTTFGAGSNTFALPTPAKAYHWRFNGELLDTGFANYMIQGRIVPGTSTTNVELVYRTTAALADSLVTSAAPIAIGSTDVVSVFFSYEAA